jgi:hypothetical protein
MITNGSFGTRFAASFREQLLDAAWDIEIVVDLDTKSAYTNISFSGILSTHPVVSMSLDSLKQLSRALSAIKANAWLLESSIDGAKNQKLDCAIAGASAVLMRPEGKPARFTLSIGPFHREGTLDSLPTNEINEAINKVESLQRRVVEKITDRPADLR